MNETNLQENRGIRKMQREIKVIRKMRRQIEEKETTMQCREEE